MTNNDVLLNKAFPGMRVLFCAFNRDGQHQTLELLLSVLELTVDWAENLEKAVFKASLQHYDVVLIDLEVPFKSGVEVVQRLRGMNGYKAASILGMTVDGSSEKAPNYLQAGLSDFLPKPVETHAFLMTLRYWLMKSRLVEVKEESVCGCEISLTQRLTQLPGIDMRVAMQAGRGQAERYLGYLRLFREYHVQDVNKLMLCLLQNDVKAAEDIAHKLKGVSSTLGLISIQLLSADLNVVLREQLPLSTIKPFMVVLDAELKRFCLAFDQLCEDLALL